MRWNDDLEKFPHDHPGFLKLDAEAVPCMASRRKDDPEQVEILHGTDAVTHGDVYPLSAFVSWLEAGY